MEGVTIAETEPLLGTGIGQTETLAREPNAVVDFDPNGDLENPLDWPKAFKWGIVALLAFMAFTVTFTCISIVPIASAIVADLSDGEGSKSASVLLVTIWEFGEAAGPLFIAPLSEIYGRYPVLNVANILFIGTIVLSALCQSTTLFIVTRALTGVTVTSNVLNPAIVGDMFASDERGTPMSIIAMAPLIGGAVGPAISGAIAQSLGWRQVLWMSAALATACEILFLTCFTETYKVPILKRRAARLREETGDFSLRTAFDSDEEKKSRRMWESVMRPADVLFGSGVLLSLSLFGSVAFAYYYIMSVTLSDILQDIYKLSPALTGSSFMSFSVGSLISIIICNLSLDRIYIKLRKSRGGIGHPEYRLPLAIFGAFALPVAVVFYGWSAQLQLPLPFVLASVAMLGMTLIIAFVPFMAYVVDAFGLYSASAMTGVIVTRCLMGTFLPLTTGPLVEHLGYGWGFTVFAGISFLLAPIPILIMRYGPVWRQRSKYTKAA